MTATEQLVRLRRQFPLAQELALSTELYLKLRDEVPLFAYLGKMNPLQRPEILGRLAVRRVPGTFLGVPLVVTWRIGEDRRPL